MDSMDGVDGVDGVDAGRGPGNAESAREDQVIAAEHLPEERIPLARLEPFRPVVERLDLDDLDGPRRAT